MATGGRRRVWLRGGDFWILLGILLLAAVAAVAITALQKPGGVAVVHTPTEDYRLPLSENAVLPLTGRDGHTVTIEVADGAARFAAADCADKICVGGGWLSHTGQSAACLPAGVLLTIETADGASGGDYDALAS